MNVYGAVIFFWDGGYTDQHNSFVVAQYFALLESICLHHIFVVTHNMLVLLRRSAEAF